LIVVRSKYPSDIWNHEPDSLREVKVYSLQIHRTLRNGATFASNSFTSAGSMNS
jgi:hypothetical protein